LVVAVLLAVSVAAAQNQDVEKAKLFFNAGAQAFEKGDYIGAIQAFERAQQIAPRPAILFSMAQAYRRQYYVDNKPEHLRAAVSAYREYIKQAPDGNRKGDAAQALTELGPAADRLGGGTGDTRPTVKKETGVSVGCDAPNAKVSVDGQPAQPAPYIHEIAPGEHTFVVSADGFITRTERIKVGDGEYLAREIPLKEVPGRLWVQTDSGAQVLVDGRIIGSAPFATWVDVEPGTRQVAVTRNGHEPAVREVELGRGEPKRVDIPLAATGQRKIAVGLLLLGGAGAVASGIFFGVSIAQEATAQSLRDRKDTVGITAAELAQYDAARGARASWLAASAVAVGTSVAIGGTGLLLYLFDQPPLNLTGPRTEKKGPEKKGPLELGAAPMLGPGLAGATLSGAF
jgi:hypothetical protein